MELPIPKYQIGQSVFILYGKWYSPGEAKIKEVKITGLYFISRGSEEVKPEYKFANIDETYQEEFVFSTRDELINNL